MLASSRWRFEVIEPLCPFGLVEAVGSRLDELVEPFQPADQFTKAISLAGCKPRVSAGGQLIKQAAAQVFFQSLPCVDWPTKPGQDRGEGEASRLLAIAPFQAREGEPEPGLVQAIDRLQPFVARFDTFPERSSWLPRCRNCWRCRDGRTRANGTDIQGLLKQRLGLDVLSLGAEVASHIIVASQCRGGRR